MVSQTEPNDDSEKKVTIHYADENWAREELIKVNIWSVSNATANEKAAVECGEMKCLSRTDEVGVFSSLGSLNLGQFHFEVGKVSN